RLEQLLLLADRRLGAQLLREVVVHLVERHGLSVDGEGRAGVRNVDQGSVPPATAHLPPHPTLRAERPVNPGTGIGTRRADQPVNVDADCFLDRITEQPAEFSVGPDQPAIQVPQSERVREGLEELLEVGLLYPQLSHRFAVAQQCDPRRDQGECQEYDKENHRHRSVNYLLKYTQPTERSTTMGRI